MIELTVKTLDSRNHPFTVEDDITVKDFKDLIAEKVDIPAETQRLIYCGRVLQDVKKLNEYDVNGKVIHLVQRAPPQANRPASDSNNFQRFHTRHQVPSPNQIFLGSMAYSADLDGQGIPQLPLSSNLSRHRLNVANKMLVLASAIIDQLENPDTDTSNVVERILDDPIDTTPLLAAQVYVPAFSNVYVDQQAALNAALSMTNNILNSENNNPQAPPAAPEENMAAPNYDDEAAGAPPPPPPVSAETEPSTTEAQTGEASGTDVPRTGTTIQTQSLAVLLEKLNRIQTRLQPFMNRYYELMNTDPTFESETEMEAAQRVCDRVSAVMHALGHGYHALSDVLCQFNRPTPRMLLCRPTLVPQAVVQAGISVPVQVQAHLDVENMTPRMDLGELFRNRTEQSSPGSEQPESETPPTTQENRVPPVTVTQRPEGGRNVDIIVAMNPDDDSISQALGPNQELIQSLLAAVTNSVMRSVSLQGGVPVSISSGSINIPVGEQIPNTSTDTTPSAPAETPATNAASNGTNGAGQNSQARGNTATLPTTSTQTPRATPRPHVHLSPHSFRAFDPFLQCNSHHITGRNRGNRQAATAPQESTPEPTSENTDQVPQVVRQARAVFSLRNLNSLIPTSTPSPSDTTATSRSQTPTRRVQSADRSTTRRVVDRSTLQSPAPPQQPSPLRPEDVLRALFQGSNSPINIATPPTTTIDLGNNAPGELLQTIIHAAIGRPSSAQTRTTPRTVPTPPVTVPVNTTETVQNGATEERTTQASNKRNTSEASTTSMDVDTFYDAPGHAEDSETGTSQKVLLPTSNGEGSSPPPNIPEVNIGSEFWHNNVPSEWVSVVTRDVQVQRQDSTTTQQPPYSDAYLSSVPAKRRKLISCNKPQGSLPQVITESLRQAVMTTGLGTVAPIEMVTAAAGGDSTIQAAYREELRQSIRARPSHATPPGGIAPIKRFPNASFCFQKP